MRGNSTRGDRPGVHSEARVAAARSRRRIAVWLVAFTAGTLLSFASGGRSGQHDPRFERARGATATDTPAAVPRLYPRAGYAWPFASGPHYGHAAPREARRGGLLVTSVGSFALGPTPLPFPAQLADRPGFDGRSRRYALVQLDAASVGRDGWKALDDALRAHGGAVLRHLPVAVALVRITPAAEAALSGLPGLLTVEPYHPAFKLDPAIGRTPHPDPARALSDEYALDVILHRGEDVRAAADGVERLGGRVLQVFADRLVVELEGARLADLARLDAVDRVYERHPVIRWDQQITNALQTGAIRSNANPYHDAGIRGGGQVLMVLDDGIQLDAADLSDTSTSPGTPGPGHRKVLSYGTTAPFGGSGDDRGCDAPEQGGFTHGHLVAAVALGNAAHPTFTFEARDRNGRRWALTGVAPDAKLVAYDAAITPAVGSCQDPLLGALSVGDLHDALAAPGVLNDAHDIHGARVFNLSWGNALNSYGALATDVDDFLHANPAALVVAAAGNLGRDADGDGRPDPASIGEPATAKSALVVGASGGPDDHDDPDRIAERAPFSGVGPAGAAGRVAPILMAPGQERGTTGPAIAFGCRSSDNDSLGAVGCDLVSGKAGTSYAAAGAAGTALLVRDYFARGFYPDGTTDNPGNAADEVPDVSGALVKSVLIASAEFLGRDPGPATTPGPAGGFAPGAPGTGGARQDNLSVRHRFNHEQGYGRIRLDRALPLTGWADSPTGLLAIDGGTAGGVNGIGGSLTGTIDATTATVHSGTFELCDDTRELRVALSWYEESGDFLINDLDLELVAPDGSTYFGNYFTDDDDRDGRVDPLLEDCPSRFDDGTPHDGGLDRSPWSLATCTRPGDGVVGPSLPPRDAANPTEAIFLSPNPQGDLGRDGEPVLRSGRCDDGSDDPCGYHAQCNGGAICAGGTSQVQAGTWLVTVRTKGAGTSSSQPYALVVAGGVCSGSSVTLDRATYACNADATIAVNERSEASDPGGGLSPASVAARTTVEVLSDTGAVLDTESGTALGFLQESPNTLRFLARAPLTDGTAYEAGNGVLDVRHGDTVRVRYADHDGGSPDPDKLREATATVGCRVDALAGLTRFPRFGQDTSFLVVGGCERNARGMFEFGLPDNHLDAGELIGYRFGFVSVEDAPLTGVTATLRCVQADADSPAACQPGSDDCADPERANNPPCTELTIFDPRQTLGRIEAHAAAAPTFAIRVNGTVTGTPVIELLLELVATSAGKTAPTRLVHRHRLNVDETSVHYSTDFPQGGTLTRDRDNNGLIENPTSTTPAGHPRLNDTDHRFETVIYGDLTSGLDSAGNPVPVNDGLLAPWNFDNNDGGFTSGLAAGSDDAAIAETLAQWGEDKNFNNALDGHCRSAPGERCDRFPIDPIGCGFCDAASTNAGAPCSGGDCPGGSCDFECVGVEDRDPENQPVPVLDQNWSTAGGCGWQTRAPGTCAGDGSIGCYVDGDCGAAGTCTGPPQATGGIWHTGRIRSTTEMDCAFVGDGPGRCQVFETVSGVEGRYSRLELLLTPVVTKVNRQRDAAGDPLATAEIVDWRWNQSVDLPDANAAYTIEFDHDVDALEPVDLTSDMSVLTTAAGPFGALSGGNPQLTRGLGLFAPLDPVSGASVNGTVGNNRVGRNACLFEGGAVPPDRLDSLFTGLPPDDDLNEGYCPGGIGRGGLDPHLNYCTTVCSDNVSVACAAAVDCAGTCVGGAGGFCGNAPATRCNTAADCDFGTCVDILCNGVCVAPGTASCSNGLDGVCNSDADCTAACVFTSAAIDEYVTPSGPVRGHELGDWNGPDMRFDTLADLFGTAGERFRGAIGFWNREAVEAPEAVGGYGLGIDDVVLEWREFTLDEDTTDCALGACATIGFATTQLYAGRTVVGITVLDATPSDNDCDLDGTVDVPAGADCDGDGRRDVVVRVDSPQEPAGERLILNAADAGNLRFVGAIAVSSAYDVPGTLYVAPTGDAAATIRATYLDRDDGTGAPCPSSVDETRHGIVRAEATVFLRPAPLVVRGYTLTDNGDDDGWADSGETVDLTVEVRNPGPADLRGITLRLGTTSPTIDCVAVGSVAFGDLSAGESRQAPAAFQFVVASGVERTSALEELTARFRVDLTADGIDGTAAAQELVLDLDLDASGGGAPTIFFESFEGGFGHFTTLHLDETLNPPDSDLGNARAGLANADGHRCPDSDPGWRANGTFGNAQGSQCFPNPDGASDAFWFDVVTDRAASGVQALGWTAFLDAARGYSTPTAQLEAIRSTDPINLGYDRVCSESSLTPCTGAGDCPPGESCDAVRPVLSFKHQISLLDDRSIRADPAHSADRAVVAVQLADAVGDPAGPWIKVQPFTNVYDAQASSNFFNCAFDPTDDGNDEDDFFDPTDPTRSRGPSSTCAPGFVFAHQGSTTGAFDATRIGRAEGPGLPGTVGDGTWVEPQIDLTRFRGRRVRVRFLATSLKFGDALTWEEALQHNPDAGDDGWFLDDVTVTGAIADPPALLVPDSKDNSALPGCGSFDCSFVVATLTPSTLSTAAPGRAVELDGSASAVDVCKDGVLQFRFWVERNGTGTFQPGVDTLLRDWSDDPRYTDAPCATREYGMEARCATDVSCASAVTTVVGVDCPAAQPADCACPVPTGGVAAGFAFQEGLRYWIAPPQHPDATQGITDAEGLQAALRAAAADPTLNLHVARHVPYDGDIAYACYPTDSRVFEGTGIDCWWYDDHLTWNEREGVEVRLTDVAAPPVFFTWRGEELPPVVYPSILGFQLYAVPYDTLLSTASELRDAFGAAATSISRFLSTSDSLQTYAGISPATDFPLETGQAYRVQLTSGAPGTLADGTIDGTVFTDFDASGDLSPPDCGLEGLEVSAQHLELPAVSATTVTGPGGGYTLSTVPGPYLLTVSTTGIDGAAFSQAMVRLAPAGTAVADLGRVPQPELCNGHDDDCDGTVDGFATFCGTGECRTSGTCVAGVDDCTPLPPRAEVCNALDDDCDGTPDNAPTDADQPCGVTDVGPCSLGTTVCSAGNLSCVGNVDPVPETCNTLDDDCDGIDDNVACGVGACRRTGTCAGMIPVCTPGPPGVETCNGVDDNCDGLVDGVRHGPN